MYGIWSLYVHLERPRYVYALEIAAGLLCLYFSDKWILLGWIALVELVPSIVTLLARNAQHPVAKVIAICLLIFSPMAIAMAVCQVGLLIRITVILGAAGLAAKHPGQYLFVTGTG